MSLIDTDLPYEIRAGEKTLPIETGFRTGILAEECLEDAEMSSEDKLFTVLQLYLGDSLAEIETPEEMDEAVAEIIRFHRCVDASQARKIESEKDDAGGAPARIFSYDYDAEYIFAAFYAAYRIDLAESSLHWWKFRALLMSLPDSTQFRKIIEYRAFKPDGKIPKEQKRYYEKMKRLYALPPSESERAATDGLTAAIMEGKSLAGLL